LVIVEVVGSRRRSIPEIFPARGSSVQAGGGLDGTTVVSGGQGREAAGSVGTVGLDGVSSKGERTEVI